MAVVQTKQIKNIEEFCKLFKINIPVKEEFNYYISVLRQSSEFDHIDQLIASFIEFEEWIVENGYESIGKYKMMMLDKIKDYILISNSYVKMQSAPLPIIKLETKDQLNKYVDTGEILMSLDFVSANYNVLKTFDESFELQNTWISLCEKFDIHPTLTYSKSFRQIVFGNTNPKRLQTFQHEKIMRIKKEILDCISVFSGKETSEDIIVFLSHDEIVLKIESPAFAEYILRCFNIFSELANGMKLKATYYSLKKIKKNVFIKTFYDLSLTGFYKTYDVLHGVPGHKFYMYFKEFVLNQQLDERDLMYFSDGELCQWIAKDHTIIKKAKLPHYDKPVIFITLEEAKKGYSYLWNNMSEIVPSILDEEKRRIIEIVAGACKHCFQEESGCQCWNDD